MKDDGKLLLRYVQENSQEAFAELVRHHVDLVYSAALRRCNGDSHRAEDAVQQVFVSLAQNAGKLAQHPALEAWLYAATRNAIINLLVSEQRRTQREQEAVMSGLLTAEDKAPDWAEIRPVLDAVMDELNDADRMAVLMRFFKKHSFAEIGGALNVSENTARMRTERALEKLRVLLGRRGVASASAALGVILTQQAVGAAPVGLAGSVASAVLGVPVGSVTGAGMVQIGLKKLVVGLVALVLVGIVGIKIYSNRASSRSPEVNEAGKAPAVQQAAPAQGVSGGMVGSASGQSRQVVAGTAEQVLQKMVEAYQALSAYEDEGEVWGESSASAGALRQRMTFRTYFLRPNCFRFDMEESLPASLKGKFPYKAGIWQNGGKAHGFYHDPTKIEEYKEHSLSIGSLHPESYGSSFNVPYLFYPHAVQPWFSLEKLQGAVLAGEEEQQGVPCYRVTGRHPNGTPYEIWMGKVDFLIRKIRSRTTLSVVNSTRQRASEGYAVEEVHRNIKINGQIPLATFEPNPSQ